MTTGSRSLRRLGQLDNVDNGADHPAKHHDPDKTEEMWHWIKRSQWLRRQGRA